jgi:hypothetical protein
MSPLSAQITQKKIEYFINVRQRRCNRKKNHDKYMASLSVCIALYSAHPLSRAAR